MQHRTAAKCAVVLVLSSDRRPEMLVRRQADAFKIIVALAGVSKRTSECPAERQTWFQRTTTICWMHRRRFRSIPTPNRSRKQSLKWLMRAPCRLPRRTLTRDDLRAWANSMAAMTAEPIVTILDRWPDEELPQHRTKPTPVEQPSAINTRTIMVVAIMFMALLAVLMTTFTNAGGARRGRGPQLLGQ